MRHQRLQTWTIMADAPGTPPPKATSPAWRMMCEGLALEECCTTSISDVPFLIPVVSCFTLVEAFPDRSSCVPVEFIRTYNTTLVRHDYITFTYNVFTHVHAVCQACLSYPMTSGAVNGAPHFRPSHTVPVVARYESNDGHIQKTFCVYDSINS